MYECVCTSYSLQAGRLQSAGTKEQKKTDSAPIIPDETDTITVDTKQSSIPVAMEIRMEKNATIT